MKRGSMRDASGLPLNKVLKILRDRFDLTLVDLGRASEINISTLSLFENGKGKLSKEARARLQVALIQALRKIEEVERERAEQKRRDALGAAKALKVEGMEELSSNLVNYAVGISNKALSKEEMEELKSAAKP